VLECSKVLVPVRTDFTCTITPKKVTTAVRSHGKHISPSSSVGQSLPFGAASFLELLHHFAAVDAFHRRPPFSLPRRFCSKLTKQIWAHRSKYAVNLTGEAGEGMCPPHFGLTINYGSLAFFVDSSFTELTPDLGDRFTFIITAGSKSGIASPSSSQPDSRVV
jgi:hypothetical protein